MGGDRVRVRVRVRARVRVRVTVRGGLLQVVGQVLHSGKLLCRARRSRVGSRTRPAC